ncbi:ATP-dependent DNA ligase [Humibacter antri]
MATKRTASTRASDSQIVQIDGRRLKLTNLDKVLYPETGTTKGEVIAYYAQIAPHLIEHAQGRPATRKRWPNGVGTAGHPEAPFFQKNLDEGTPDWVPRVTIEHKDHPNVYPLVNDAAVLAWLGQIAALEIHVPQWQTEPSGARRNPDRLVLDLDPGEGVGLAECAEAAFWIREILIGMGLGPVPVTSGSKGIHLYARLDGAQTSDQVSQVAHELARALEADHKDEVISTMKRADRAGKVFIDWSQNNANKTTIAPYSLRGRAHPMVAAPRTWHELASSKLTQLGYEEVLKRMATNDDPLVETTPHTPGEADRLTVYRGKRNAAKTPEPVPKGTPTTTNGRSFVIQRHAARRLHYDFRLERDGVLVSWALPKGIPTDPKENHLAVHTEDHPLDYGGFEGDIPRGEYGAGHVDIWDSGVYDLEKWREGEEVIVTLHPSRDGGLGGQPAKVALIRTGNSVGGGDSMRGGHSTSGSSSSSSEADAKNWLIHRMTLESRRRDYSPMLATLGTQSQLERDDERWVFENKWDGIRALVSVQDGAVRLMTRNGHDVTAQYPELTAIVDGVRSPGVLDGEIVALNDGHPDFGLLQQRMNLQNETEISHLASRVPVRYYAFDILELDGHDITGEEYEVRRAALEHVVTDPHHGVLQVPDVVSGPIGKAMATSRQAGLEGIVAKDRESIYSSGKRSTAWIKVKHHSTQEVVVGGWKPGEGRRANGIGSLLLGIPDAGIPHANIPDAEKLTYVGKVGTGFGDADLDDIAKRLGNLEADTDPFGDIPKADARGVHWVTPTLVAEVEFAEWTRGGRLRQPSWRGWRPDKDPKDVVREG